MRGVDFLPLLALSMLCTMPIAGAQCAISVTMAQCPVSNGSCSHIVPKVIPGAVGWVPISGEVNCCGELETLPVNFLPDCETASIKDGASLQQLAALATKTDLLAVTCDGYIRHFRVIGANPASGRWSSLTETSIDSEINAKALPDLK